MGANEVGANESAGAARVRVLIAATNLRSSSIGGGEQFVLGLANALASTSDIDVGLLVRSEVIPRVLEVLHPRVDLVQSRGVPGMMRIPWDAVTVGLYARKWGADVLHYPHEWRPLFFHPVILTVQNIFWMHPRTSQLAGLRGMVLRTMTRVTARRADALVAVSDIAAKLWSDVASVEPHRVIVVPEGVSVKAGRLRPGSGEILAVVGPREYKNLGLVVSAAQLLRTRGLQSRIIVAGACGDDTEHLGFLGWLPHAELVERMASAQVVLFPSAVESFGLPAFEAVELGVPCVVLEGTAMAEWLGGMVTPSCEDVEAIADAVISAQSSGSFWHVPAGFRWEDVVGLWVKVYAEAKRAHLVESGTARGDVPPMR